MRKPKESLEEFQTSLFKPEPIMLAASELLPGMLADTQGGSLSLTPTPDDLAPTEDIQLTEAIAALAADLDHNPVKIFNWVHDHIEFLPTYGSIQGAHMTLEAKKGNAFDTASLLIALLRAANIPARYVYGTIQLPIEKVMNWVGGVTVPEAALEVLGQGGIPSTGLVQGGAIKAVRFEHVWVEAWVDFMPSRGTVHRAGDTWVPLDAAFKQYHYTEGMDLLDNVRFDTQAFVEQLTASAQVDETAGWVRGVDHGLVQSTLLTYQDQIDAYVEAQKADATVGDVLGAKTILVSQRPVLAAGLPYHLVVRGATFTAVPDHLRHKFRFTLYASALDRSFDTPVWSVLDSLPKLAGKKITLSFAPASLADAETIASYLPEPPADDSSLDPSTFPVALPGYLIHLVAELRVDDDVVARGGPFTMGQTLLSTQALFDPVHGWQTVENPVVAGEHQAFAIEAASISASQVQSLEARITATTAQLATQDLAGLTQEDLLGDLLYAVVLSYFAMNAMMARLSAPLADVVTYRRPSFGRYTAVVQPQYWFGLPRTVTFSGLEMDIDRIASIAVSSDHDRAVQVAYIQQLGQWQSSLEHKIPERLFTNADRPGEAVSTMKALAVASREGQQIYTITQDNIASALSQLTIAPDVKTAIEGAVAGGKQAIVSQHPVTVSGWTGVGYIILDPETGSGAYLISGGANGSLLLLNGLALLAIALIMFSGGFAIGASALAVGAIVPESAGLLIAGGVLLASVLGMPLAVAGVEKRWEPNGLIYPRMSVMFLRSWVPQFHLCWQQ